MSQAIVSRDQTVAAVEGMLAKSWKKIGQIVPKHLKPDRLLRVAILALERTPGLRSCTPASLAGGIVQASVLGLEIGDGLNSAHLIPFKKRGKGNQPDVMIATFVLGYGGMIDLALRSGRISTIFAFEVYKGDDFAQVLGDDPKIEHRRTPEGEENVGDPKRVTHVYAVAKMKDGGTIYRVLSRKQVELHRSRSKAKDGPWVTDWIEMALKTAIRVLFKYLPKSPEMAQAYQLDVAADTGDPQGLEDLVTADATVTNGGPKGGNGGGLASLGQSTTPSKPKATPKKDPEPEPNAPGAPQEPPAAPEAAATVPDAAQGEQEPRDPDEPPPDEGHGQGGIWE